jgi:hypothetical protein
MFVPIITRRVHHVTSHHLQRQTEKKKSIFVGRSLDRHVGLKVATHVWRCISRQMLVWCVVFCFWPHCSQTLPRRPRRQPVSTLRTGRPWLLVITAVEDHPLLAVHDRLFNILAPAVSLTEQNCSPGRIQTSRLLSFVIGWTFRTLPQDKMLAKRASQLYCASYGADKL